MRLIVSLVFCSMLVLPPEPLPAQSTPKHPAPSKIDPAQRDQLPVTRVSLYKNGVGFFEHAGHVTGNQSVTIEFTTAQLNDVLQSLTAVDLNGGRISGAGYNSTTPIEQQLKALPLGLGEDPSTVDFYNAIRGARVEVHTTSGAFAGRLLNIELRTTPAKDDQPGVETRFLTIVSDTGAVRTIQITPATEVRLLDSALHTDVTRYLQLLADTRNQGLRRLTLQDNGTGQRDLRVSYISEVPIWKSTYRILFTGPTTPQAKQTATLQGWSVVDNTTGTDWTNVQLSLIAGAPQSFIQPLSIPYYNRRPEIGLPQEAQLSPQTHDSGNSSDIKMLKEDGAPSPQVAGVAGMSSGSGFGSGVGGGVMGGIGNAPLPSMARKVRNNADAFAGGGLAPAPTIEYETAANNSIAPQTTTSAFDDYFEYKLSQPITIRKNESALVPILQTKVDTERVTLVSPENGRLRPLRALWITNTSDITLDRGSFSIVEDGNFGGEGLLDPIHPKERRLLSYAADTAVRVTTESNHNSGHVTSITASKGVLVMHRSEVAEVTYLVHNAATEPRTIILEHPVRQGFVLDSDPKPEETTASVYRFRVQAGAGETIRLHVGEKRTSNSQYQLVRSDDSQLTYILNESSRDAKLTEALQPILEARRRVAEAQEAVTATNERLTALRAEEERQRANIVALKDADKSARTRFVNELNQSEDQITQQQKEFTTRDVTLKTAQQDLTNKIAALQIDETL
ncbi:DUF4139 domain-containing protein [Granulicella arctica]|uniref:DUF4139 domain-containing protein n=1 Tax=Granulicella arctica TaxID=940613 RepID=UPI0021DFE4C6|nr:DUF4139 domain-containing protein [Granulicella arctica]